MTGRMVLTANHYLEGDTKGNLSASMRKAGYSQSYANTRCSVLSKNIEFKKALAKRKAEIDEQEAITIEVCNQRFDDLYYACISKNDRTNAVRVVENQAKYVGYYEADNIQRQEQYNIAVKNEEYIIAQGIAEAARLARALDEAPDAIAGENGPLPAPWDEDNLSQPTDIEAD